MINLIEKVYPYLACSGTALIFIGVLIAIFPFRDRDGRRYALRNHFISELGEKGVSKAAWGFNTGMFLGGWLFLPMMIALGIRLHSVTGWIGMAFGILASVTASLVGVFSMDRLTKHRKVAMTFFNAGLYCILFFTIAIFAQPADNRVVPIGINAIGILAISSFSGFLVTVKSKTNRHHDPNYILDPNHFPERPEIWRTPILEWSIFFLVNAWFVAAALLS